MYSYVGSYGIAITKLQWWKVIKYKVNISSTVFVLHLNVYFSDDVLPFTPAIGKLLCVLSIHYFFEIGLLVVEGAIRTKM